MALLAPGVLPRRGQRCLIDGEPAVHTGAGEFHLIDANGETVMREGKTYVVMLRARMNQLLAAARALDGGVERHVTPASDPADSWISGVLAEQLKTSGLLVHALGSGTEIELIEPERLGIGLADHFGGSAAVETSN